MFHFSVSTSALAYLSAVLAAGGALPPPCRAADVRETLAHLLSPEMRRLDGEEKALHEELRELPPVPAPPPLQPPPSLHLPLQLLPLLHPSPLPVQQHSPLPH